MCPWRSRGWDHHNQPVGAAGSGAGVAPGRYGEVLGFGWFGFAADRGNFIWRGFGSASRAHYAGRCGRR